MKPGIVKLLALILAVSIAVLTSGCVSYTISSFNLAKLEGSQPDEGPQVDAYFQPLGELLYTKDREFHDPTRGVIPRSHLFFSLLTIMERLDGSDISLSEPVHVRATSNKIELTFTKKNQETVTFTLPQEPNGDPNHDWLIRGQSVYCKDGQLLIMREYRVLHPESYSDYNNAIVFQILNGSLAVHTRQYLKAYGTLLFPPFPTISSTYVHQAGYLYQRTADEL